MIKCIILLLSLSIASTITFAHQHETAVVPDAEKTIAAAMNLDGPSETKGIGYAKQLGLIDLGNEFPGMEGYVMRMREISILPEGQVATHQHTSRPGMAYIVEGEAVEYRSDEAEPQVRKSGDAAIEASGIIHWWINKGSEPAKVVVVDILQVED